MLWSPTRTYLSPTYRQHVFSSVSSLGGGSRPRWNVRGRMGVWVGPVKGPVPDLGPRNLSAESWRTGLPTGAHGVCARELDTSSTQLGRCAARLRCLRARPGARAILKGWVAAGLNPGWLREGGGGPLVLPVQAGLLGNASGTRSKRGRPGSFGFPRDGSGWRRAWTPPGGCAPARPPRHQRALLRLPRLRP